MRFVMLRQIMPLTEMVAVDARPIVRIRQAQTLGQSIDAAAAATRNLTLTCGTESTIAHSAAIDEGPRLVAADCAAGEVSGVRHKYRPLRTRPQVLILRVFIIRLFRLRFSYLNPVKWRLYFGGNSAAAPARSHVPQAKSSSHARRQPRHHQHHRPRWRS